MCFPNVSRQVLRDELMFRDTTRINEGQMSLESHTSRSAQAKPTKKRPKHCAKIEGGIVHRSLGIAFQVPRGRRQFRFLLLSHTYSRKTQRVRMNDVYDVHNSFSITKYHVSYNIMSPKEQHSDYHNYCRFYSNSGNNQ